MVLFGIFNTRLGIGIEIFTNNLIYGPLAYLFIAFAGIMVIRFIKFLHNPLHDSRLSKNRVIILTGVCFFIGFILAIVNVIENMAIYYLNYLIIIFTVFLGILWCFFSYIGLKFRKNINLVSNLLETLTFTMGLLYGAFLNTYLIPVFLFFFFISVTFLQLSRDILKPFSEKGKDQNNKAYYSRIDNKKSFKFSLYFQSIALFFLILVLFSNIIDSISILILMILNLILTGFAIFVSMASIAEIIPYKRISSILKISIFLELLLLLAIGS